ncbi:MAG: winged helix-turn-helix domain-containing protein, partial [Thermodesulfobacteriota bacterium]
MNREKQRELVEAKLRRNPELSDRQIAKELEVSPTTVGTVRKELEEKGEMSKLDKLNGTGKEVTLEASLNQL